MVSHTHREFTRMKRECNSVLQSQCSALYDSLERQIDEDSFVEQTIIVSDIAVTTEILDFRDGWPHIANEVARLLQAYLNEHYGHLRIIEAAVSGITSKGVKPNDTHKVQLRIVVSQKKYTQK